MKILNKIILLLAILPLAGCDLLADKYRVEFRGGSWREIAISPFSKEVRWREGCASGEVLNDMALPYQKGEVIRGRQQLLIGGERFELDGNKLYRSNGMVFGLSPDYIQRGLEGLDSCLALRPARGGLPRLTTRGFGG
ncbi:MAG: hypothetical protein ACRCWL_15425 [Aeromonas sp.]